MFFFINIFSVCIARFLLFLFFDSAWGQRRPFPMKFGGMMNFGVVRIGMFFCEMNSWNVSSSISRVIFGSFFRKAEYPCADKGGMMSPLDPCIFFRIKFCMMGHCPLTFRTDDVRFSIILFE